MKCLASKAALHRANVEYGSLCMIVGMMNTDNALCLDRGQVSQSSPGGRRGVGPSVGGTVCMVTDWDVSQVKNMGHMFSHARAFNQPLAGLGVFRCRT